MSTPPKNLNEAIGLMAGQLAAGCQASGLTWDESVAMLGLTAKVLVTIAKAKDPATDCQELGQRRLLEGFAQEMDLKFVSQSSDAKH